jgi:hypothetical protein
MQVTKVKWFADRQLLVFIFDTNAFLTYGAGVLPGTDAPTYRFVWSQGFNGSKEAYNNGKALAYAYSRDLGFKGTQEHFEHYQNIVKAI